MKTRHERPPLVFVDLNWHSLSLAQRKAIVKTYGLRAKGRWGETYWTECMENPGAIGLSLAKWLVAQGQSLDAKDGIGRMGLHLAAAQPNVPMVKWLLAQGASVTKRESDGTTALDAACAQLHESDASMKDRRRVLALLLAAGAKPTPAARARVRYVCAELLRGNPTKKTVLADVRALCRQFALPMPRLPHDGRRMIEIVGTNADERFDLLWEYLVQPNGNAKTLQGEVVRTAGRIDDELQRNGGENWDDDYRKMARFFVANLRGGEPLNDDEIAAIDRIVAKLDRARPRWNDSALRTLRDAGVAWVARNPKPRKCPRVDYRR